MPPVTCGILPRKRVPAPNARLEGGRDVLYWVCVRRIRPHVWCAFAGTIPLARRFRVGRAEVRCLAAMARTRGLFICGTGYGVSFARPDCTRIEEGIVWAKPHLVRTGSLEQPLFPCENKCTLISSRHRAGLVTRWSPTWQRGWEVLVGVFRPGKHVLAPPRRLGVQRGVVTISCRVLLQVWKRNYHLSEGGTKCERLYLRRHSPSETHLAGVQHCRHCRFQCGLLARRMSDTWPAARTSHWLLQMMSDGLPDRPVGTVICRTDRVFEHCQ